MNGFKQHIARLRGLLRRRGRTREDADDLIQEAFLRLHVYCQQEEVRKQDAFLTRTVLNLSVDMYRKERHLVPAVESVGSELLVDLEPTPEEAAVASQRLARVLAVLEDLSPRTREIFLMHRVEGYSGAQIAQRFGISVSAVEKHVAKAVLALMDVVES